MQLYIHETISKWLSVNVDAYVDNYVDTSANVDNDPTPV